VKAKKGEGKKLKVQGSKVKGRKRGSGEARKLKG
jgi:hypothetical protein